MVLDLVLASGRSLTKNKIKTLLKVKSEVLDLVIASGELQTESSILV